MDDLELVRLTLIGMADSAGQIMRWSASDALEISGLGRDAFERALAVLEHAGDVRVDRAGRRKFYLAAAMMKRKYEADLFVRERRVFPAGAPGFTIENLEATPSRNPKYKRWVFDLHIDGIATIKACVYVLGADNKAFVAMPSRQAGQKYQAVGEFTREFQLRVLESVKNSLTQKAPPHP